MTGIHAATGDTMEPLVSMGLSHEYLPIKDVYTGGVVICSCCFVLSSFGRSCDPNWVVKNGTEQACVSLCL